MYTARSDRHWYDFGRWGEVGTLFGRSFWYGAERRRVEAVIGDLGVGRSWDVEALRARIEGRQGRPIRLIPVDRRDLPCGLWVRTGAEDLVLYARSTSPGHQRHIVAHEFAHILLDHGEAASPDLTIETAARLFSTLDPRSVARVLGRSEYGPAQEREAELLATLLLSGSHRTRARIDREGRLQRLARGMGDAPQR